MREGTIVRITQSHGDSYTVVSDLGYQYRVDASDSDALGLSIPAAARSEHNDFSEQAVWDQLRTVFDPEIPVNIVDLGLVYSCRIEPRPNGHRIEISMTMTAPGCGMANVLKSDIERKLRELPTVTDVSVAVVFDPPWHPGKISDAAKLQLGLDLDSAPTTPGLPTYRTR
jgi:probable FeS assembly SUF system protein SufT